MQAETVRESRAPETGAEGVIIRADKAFFEAMHEAGYNLDLAGLRAIYEAAKKKRPKRRSDTRTLSMFPELDEGGNQ